MASLDAGLPDCDVTANGVTSSHSRSVAVTTTPYRQSSAGAVSVEYWRTAKGQGRAQPCQNIFEPYRKSFTSFLLSNVVVLI